MTAIGVLETVKARRLADLADISGCLTLEALNGTTAALTHAFTSCGRILDRSNPQLRFARPSRAANLFEALILLMFRTLTRFAACRRCMAPARTLWLMPSGF